MARKSTKPASKTELEEAEWHASPEGRRQTRRAFERALRSGTVVRSSGLKVPKTDAKVLASLVEEAKERATRAVSLRIPIVDLERARTIAKKTGVGYQSVMKKALREGLKRVG
jgi:hypothetical protein